MRGITILALDKPTYGKFAYNLALSIRYHSPNVRIQLIYNESALSHLSDAHFWPNGKKLFDVKTVIKKEDMYHDGRLSIGKAKINLYKYFAFDETIYLDSDSIVVRDIEYIFDNVEQDYHTIIVGKKHLDNFKEDFGAMQWASVQDMVKVFDLKEGMTIPATNSSFQYYKKSATCDEIHTKMLENFENGISDTDLKMRWGKSKYYDGQPDELYLNVTLAQLGIWPEIKQEPLCFKIKRSLNPSLDYKKYSILSLFGGKNFTHNSVLSQYEREMRVISKNLINRHHEFKVATLMRDKLVDN